MLIDNHRVDNVYHATILRIVQALTVRWMGELKCIDYTLWTGPGVLFLHISRVSYIWCNRASLDRSDVRYTPQECTDMQSLVERLDNIWRDTMSDMQICSVQLWLWMPVSLIAITEITKQIQYKYTLQCVHCTLYTLECICLECMHMYRKFAHLIYKFGPLPGKSHVNFSQETINHSHTFL